MPKYLEGESYCQLGSFLSLRVFEDLNILGQANMTKKDINKS